jgi:hypothetical protein
MSETSYMSDKDMLEQVDDEESFVVDGAKTICTGSYKIPGAKQTEVSLQTDPENKVQARVGYAIQMLNTDSNKDRNFSNKGKWYGICAARFNKKCEPDFLDEWFDYSKVAGYSSVFELLKSYEESVKNLSNMTQSFIDYEQSKLDELTQKEELLWLLGDIVSLINKDKKQELADKIERAQNLNVPSGFDPKLFSVNDGCDDYNNLTSLLKNLSNLDMGFQETEMYNNINNELDEVRKKLEGITGHELYDAGNGMFKNRDNTAPAIIKLFSPNKAYYFLLKKSILVCKRGSYVKIIDNGQSLAFAKELKQELIDEIKKRFPDDPDYADELINKLGIEAESDPYKLLDWVSKLIEGENDTKIYMDVKAGLYENIGIGRNMSGNEFDDFFQDAKEKNDKTVYDLPIKDPAPGSVMDSYEGHTGKDFHYEPVRYDAPIYATTGGKVVETREGLKQGDWGNNTKGAGNYVRIIDAEGVSHYYAHLVSPGVESGNYVLPGETIGIMGNSGNTKGATGIHLHYEIQPKGREWNSPDFIDPEGYLRKTIK